MCAPTFTSLLDTDEFTSKIICAGLPQVCGPRNANRVNKILSCLLIETYVVTESSGDYGSYDNLTEDVGFVHLHNTASNFINRYMLALGYLTLFVDNPCQAFSSLPTQSGLPCLPLSNLTVTCLAKRSR